MALTQAFKNTYWNNIRVERNIKIQEIADFLNVSLSSAGGYFSGQLMPKDLQIKQLCGLFDVPVDVGREEFKKAHALWKSERKRSGVKIQTGTIEKKQTEITVDMTAKQFEVDNADIIKMIYGKLPYELFENVRKMIKYNSGDVLEQLYGKVSYKEFVQIQEALQNG